MLEVYEERLVAQGVPVIDWQRPGLSDREIDAALAPLGLTPPIEARVWWGWHDGSPGSGLKKLIAPAGQMCLTLSEAVDACRSYRKFVQEKLGSEPPTLDDPNFRWEPSWLPITGFQLPEVIDCSVAEGQPTPVRLVSMENPFGSREPRAASLGQMVLWWVQAIDSGAWSWDTGRGEWKERVELLDDAFRRSGLC